MVVTMTVVAVTAATIIEGIVTVETVTVVYACNDTLHICHDS
jgi:hypothetical protein